MGVVWPMLLTGTVSEIGRERKSKGVRLGFARAHAFIGRCYAVVSSYVNCVMGVGLRETSVVTGRYGGDVG